MGKLGYFLAILIMITQASCKSNKVSVQRTEIRAPGENASSSGVVIKGKIMEILEKKDNDSNSVCKNSPCFALVKVLEVFQNNDRFSNFITEGDVFEMFFAFTLLPTSIDLFPNLDKRLPGLKVNDNFKAGIKITPGISGRKEKIEVIDYQIVE
jgi:hypothetical protein